MLGAPGREHGKLGVAVKWRDGEELKERGDWKENEVWCSEGK